MTKRRGRPRNSDRPHTATADAIIGRTVWQLLAWGFPLRAEGGIAEEVARLACAMLGRHDNLLRPLSHDRIEQIFEAWHRSATRPAGWATGPQQVGYGRPWQFTKVDSLRQTAPGGSLPELAAKLIADRGEWLGSLPGEHAALGDPEPTVKGWEQMGMLQPVRGDKTG